MFEELKEHEWYVLGGAAIALLLVGFGVGFAAMPQPQSSGTGGKASPELRQTVQKITNMQIQRQRQRLGQMINQSPSLTSADVSLDARVSSIQPAEYGTLYEAKVTIQGNIPSRTGNSTRSVNRQQSFFITQDGRYLFQSPTDLQRMQQRPSPPQPPTQ